MKESNTTYNYGNLQWIQCSVVCQEKLSYTLNLFNDLIIIIIIIITALINRALWRAFLKFNTISVKTIVLVQWLLYLHEPGALHIPL